MPRRSSAATLPPFDPDSGLLNAIVETVTGSRNKFSYDERLGLFRLKHVLPAGAIFPFDFGFVPSTRGGDGDPLDVLVLMDAPAFAGCLVPSRLVGVIAAEQSERGGPTEENDRLVAVAADSHTHEGVRTLDDLAATLLDEIEHFFVSYNEARGKTFTPTARKGPRAARAVVDAATRRTGRVAKKSRGRHR